MESFVLSNATETETRPEHAEILSMPGNRMRDCRFSLASLSVKPEDTWCGGVLIVDPIDDFVQDFGSRAFEAPLCAVQPNFVRTVQEVRGDVFINIFNTVLDVRNRSISKLLHKRL